jgi:vacuolar-type H+-ATPase subunit E/Vma4
LDTLNNISSEANRHIRNKKREYLKDKVNELEKNSKSIISEARDL